MRYVLMICTKEAEEQALNADESSARLREYGAFSEEMGRRGVLRGGERLRPVSEATTVSVTHDKVLASDGPFAETKEQIGGFFIVDCKDRDEAVEIAAKIPGARHGKIEVRPIWEM
ncbi:MAG: YciI family protein [Chloroflexi bacterium]|nr:MAG: YciI family protein [Chloroflexota bacterium]